MRPILLQGHERSLTQIKYNREGDLLFSCSKDKSVCVWYIDNGERLGTYEGHQGSVWTCDVNWDSTRLATGGADFTVRLWDVETGTTINTIDENAGLQATAKSVSFSYCGNLIVFPSGAEMKRTPTLQIFDVRMNPSDGPIRKRELPKSEYNDGVPIKSLWAFNDEIILTGNDNGSLYVWDMNNLDELHRNESQHSKQINDMQLSKDNTMVVTASKDCTAKMFDAMNLRHLKTYKSNAPVNSAAISPRAQHVVIGGGQDARDVTTTSSRDGKFEARFFHLLMEEEFGRVKGHFGPINTLAFHPNGKSYCSGAEDGFIRAHKFDRDYLSYKDEL
jgi:translation initiation factor 3 subunit I